MQGVLLPREGGLGEWGWILPVCFTVPKVWQKRAVDTCRVYSWFRVQLWVVFPTLSTRYVAITRTKHLASPLAARARGGSAPRRSHHWREVWARLFGDKLEWGASRELFPSGKLSIRREVQGALGRAVLCGGAACGVHCWSCAGEPHRYVQKMGLGQNLLYFHGADFHSVFFMCCMMNFIFVLIKPQVNVCLRSDHGQPLHSCCTLACL